MTKQLWQLYSWAGKDEGMGVTTGAEGGLKRTKGREMNEICAWAQEHELTELSMTKGQ